MMPAQERTARGPNRSPARPMNTAPPPTMRKANEVAPEIAVRDQPNSRSSSRKSTPKVKMPPRLTAWITLQAATIR